MSNTSSSKAPRLGQNFLVSATAQRAIVESLGSLSGETVIEIGPGKAAITDLLMQRAQRVVAIELDTALASALRARFRNAGDAGSEVPASFEIVEEDVLRVDLTDLATRLAAPGASTRSLSLIGNLPYYITSDILLHLFAHEAVFRQGVVMVQREVADRMVAEPGSRDYGMLSATCQLYARVERLFSLPPEAFSPPPTVHSSVVRLRLGPRFEELGIAPKPFIAHLRHCFAQKRKTLANNLRAAGYVAEQISASLEAAGIPALARAETLSLETQAELFKQLATRTQA